MSRSYKKNPFVTDQSQGTKSMKRLANRTVRRKLKDMDELPARLPHKKMTESWMICDYKWRMTEEEAIEWYFYKMEYDASDWFKKHYPTLESWLKYWAKCYKRK